MLPSSKSSLQKGGYSAQAAAWILIAFFLAGVVGIQIVSRILHHYMPSHEVGCDHTHDEEDKKDSGHSHTATPHHHPHEERRASDHSSHMSAEMSMRASAESLRQNGNYTSADSNGVLARRPSLPYQLTKQMSHVLTRKKSTCDVNGKCYGYSEPCGIECFNNVQARGGSRFPSLGPPRHPGLSRSFTTPRGIGRTGERQPLLQDIREESPFSPPKSDSPILSANGSTGPSSYASLPQADAVSDDVAETEFDQGDEEQGHDHHHHVPTNAFLSIGLQTSIAIALHKLPEGFITYATNHANPRLGFAVFMALFIHNITEGFALALPLYLAIQSKWKAMAWSTLLGGASQPLGAAVAALWFRVAGTGDNEPGEGVYGMMFALTCKCIHQSGFSNADTFAAGIMASVALTLFSESLGMTHNKDLCMAFAFVGMAILGVSSALTA